MLLAPQPLGPWETSTNTTSFATYGLNLLQVCVVQMTIASGGRSVVLAAHPLPASANCVTTPYCRRLPHASCGAMPRATHGSRPLCPEQPVPILFSFPSGGLSVSGQG